MDASDISYKGALLFLAGFWDSVRRDLHYRPAHAPGRRVHDAAAELVARANTLAWVLDDAVTHDAMGLPVSFRAWLRFGGLEFDEAQFRQDLLDPNKGRGALYEGV